MAEKETNDTADMFEFYAGAYKSWQEIFNSWAKIMTSIPPAFKGVDAESWFKPLWGYSGDWGKAFEGFPDMIKNMPLPFQSMKDTSEAVAKGLDAYVKVYSAWIGGMDKVGREGYEIGRKLGAGEEADTGKFFDAMKRAYDDIMASELAALKDIPFTGVRGIDEAVKKSLDSFPEEQKMAKEFLQEMLSFYVKTMTLSNSAMKEATRTFADMLGKGEISGDGYKSMIDTYGEMLKHNIEIFKLPVALLPGYKDIADDATGCAKANLDLSIAWLEINLKLYQAIAKSEGETYKATEDLFKGKKISSPDEFYKAWTEIGQKSMDILVKNSQFYDNVPKFISAYTDWLTATNKLYSSVMTPPHVTKEDIDRIYEELAKLKASLEKRGTARAKPETV